MGDTEILKERLSKLGVDKQFKSQAILKNIIGNHQPIILKVSK